MAEMVANPQGTVEAPEVSKEELALVTEIIHAMMKTTKGFRIYLPNNPLLAKFVQDMMEKMERYLSRHSEFMLEIDQFELRYGGKVVYENRDPKESMAFKMYSDGIRFVIFHEGLEEFELCDFLEIVGMDRPGDVDDDIVTLLWEKNYPHLDAILTDDFFDFDAEVGGQAVSASQQEKITGIYTAASPAETPLSSLLVPHKILTLTEEETDWLRKAREADEKRKPLDDVIQIITAVLVGERDPSVFSEFVEIMTKLTENLFNSGEVRYSLNIIGFLGGLARNGQIPAANRAEIEKNICTIFSTDTAKVLARTIDTSELLPPEKLRELLLIFGKPAIGRMCELLGLVEKMKMRKVIIQVLCEIGHDTPEAFIPFLSDSRWFLVRNIVVILTRIGSPATLEPVVALISHREPRIRKEVLAYLEMIPDPKAKTCLLKFLRDESSAIRIRALQILASTKCMFALKPIVALSTSEQFQEKDIIEKTAVYEAIGELGADQTLPIFREMLTKKYWFNKAKEKESITCAVAGLVKMGSSSAVKLLKEASVAKGDEMRDIIIQGLGAIAAETVKSTAGA
jgi:hypothetical protein